MLPINHLLLDFLFLMAEVACIVHLESRVGHLNSLVDATLHPVHIGQGHCERGHARAVEVCVTHCFPDVMKYLHLAWVHWEGGEQRLRELEVLLAQPQPEVIWHTALELGSAHLQGIRLAEEELVFARHEIHKGRLQQRTVDWRVEEAPGHSNRVETDLAAPTMHTKLLGAKPHRRGFLVELLVAAVFMAAPKPWMWPAKHVDALVGGLRPGDVRCPIVGPGKLEGCAPFVVFGGISYNGTALPSSFALKAALGAPGQGHHSPLLKLGAGGIIADWGMQASGGLELGCQR
mmetsp:Transcript_38284/g.75900  ORF Transcript_38284/g.75900 Transcript_38284/m.75900 type:complete len:290 (-) Transcript_38284:300-1169(-)